MEGLLIEFLIELGNRFCPEAIFKFIFAAGIPLVLSLQLKNDAEEKYFALVRHRPKRIGHNL